MENRKKKDRVPILATLDHLVTSCDMQGSYGEYLFYPPSPRGEVFTNSKVQEYCKVNGEVLEEGKELKYLKSAFSKKNKMKT